MFRIRLIKVEARASNSNPTSASPSLGVSGNLNMALGKDELKKIKDSKKLNQAKVGGVNGGKLVFRSMEDAKSIFKDIGSLEKDSVSSGTASAGGGDKERLEREGEKRHN